MLTTTAFDRSSLEWFGARSWKPTPKGLPSSLVQLRRRSSADASLYARLRRTLEFLSFIHEIVGRHLTKLVPYEYDAVRQGGSRWVC